ncbi:hypothetical protein [uncultured Gammaproteobacteria bacterium]|nr:hypothetical protein [uncultured Gammaproteobacteria bacterium]
MIDTIIMIRGDAMKLPHLTGHQTLIVPIFFVSIIFFGVWGKAPTWNLFQALT